MSLSVRLFSTLLGVKEFRRHWFSAISCISALSFFSSSRHLVPFVSSPVHCGMDRQTWKRQVEADCPPWMNAQQTRLEEKREEAIKRRKEREEGKGQGTRDDEDLVPEQILVERGIDLAEFRSLTQNCPAFMPDRLPIMCCGRPILVLWLGLDRATTTIG